MKEVFPYRLKSARKRAGLSMRQLSEELGNLVSYNSIKKYEDGKMMPEKRVLLALSDALKVKLDYFSRPIKFDLGDIEFRKKASLGAKQIGQIKEQTRDLLERYIEVEEMFGISTAFDNPVADLSIRSEEDVEAAADELRKAWNLGDNPIPNVIQMLEEKEVKVLEIEASDKFDGLSTFVTHIPVTILNGSFPVERKRFTALHELGHLVLNLDDKATAEARCNQFAGAMLIGRDEVERLLGKRRTKVPAWGELIPIKEEYGISLQALMRRAYDLSIISKAGYQRFFKMIARNRQERDLGSFRGEEKAFRFKQLVFRLVSEGITTMNKAAALAGMTVDAFHKEYYRTLEEEDWSQTPELTDFANVYGDDEPDYDVSDLIEINPDYDPR